MVIAAVYLDFNSSLEVVLKSKFDSVLNIAELTNQRVRRGK
jgi:hypothetical protein